MAKTPRHRTAFMIDKDLYAGLKEVPRSVSMSDVVNYLLKFAIDELKKFPKGMTDEEIREWRRKDPKRLEVLTYLRDDIGLGKYVDVIDEAMQSIDLSMVEHKREKKKK